MLAQGRGERSFGNPFSECGSVEFDNSDLWTMMPFCIGRIPSGLGLYLLMIVDTRDEIVTFVILESSIGIRSSEQR